MIIGSIDEFICEDLVSLSAVQGKHCRWLVTVLKEGKYESPSTKYFGDVLLQKTMNDCTQ